MVFPMKNVAAARRIQVIHISTGNKKMTTDFSFYLYGSSDPTRRYKL